jgi:hypothetical protein
MPTNRTYRKRQSRAHVSQAAIDACEAGDMWALHRALDLPPWHLSPLPVAFADGYGLPDEPNLESDLVMDGTWHAAKALHDQLYALAGEPGTEASLLPA